MLQQKLFCEWLLKYKIQVILIFIKSLKNRIFALVQRKFPLKKFFSVIPEMISGLKKVILQL